MSETLVMIAAARPPHAARTLPRPATHHAQSCGRTCSARERRRRDLHSSEARVYGRPHGAGRRPEHESIRQQRAAGPHPYRHSGGCRFCLQGAVHDAGPIKVVAVRDARERQRGRSVDLHPVSGIRPWARGTTGGFRRISRRSLDPRRGARPSIQSPDPWCRLGVRRDRPHATCSSDRSHLAPERAQRRRSRPYG